MANYAYKHYAMVFVCALYTTITGIKTASKKSRAYNYIILKEDVFNQLYSNNTVTRTSIMTHPV